MDLEPEEEEEDEEEEEEEEDEEGDVEEGNVGHWTAPELCGELHPGNTELELGLEPKENGSGA